MTTLGSLEIPATRFFYLFIYLFHIYMAKTSEQPIYTTYQTPTKYYTSPPQLSSNPAGEMWHQFSPSLITRRIKNKNKNK